MNALSRVTSVIIVGWNITHAAGNGGAGYFRGLCRGLTRRGWLTCFLQPATDAPDDLPANKQYEVASYRSPSDIASLLTAYPVPRLLLKYLDSSTQENAVLEAILDVGDPVWLVDGDAPDTLDRIGADAVHCVRRRLPQCAGVLLATGGPTAIERYIAFGAQRATIWYAAADPQPVPTQPFTCDVLFVGNRDPGRDSAVLRYCDGITRLWPRTTINLVGAGWETMALFDGVQVFGHVAPEELTRLYRQARLVVNLTRDSQRRWGYCPSMRLFEAAAAGATIVSDSWPGMETVFIPWREILIADSPAEVVAILDQLLTGRYALIGAAAYRRIQQQHTWNHRIDALERLMSATRPGAFRRKTTE